MKALIYGGGSVGLGIASCLLRSDVHLDIIARKDTVNALRQHGLIRTGIFGDSISSPEMFSAHSSLNALPQQAYDHILVCTKSFDCEETAQGLHNHPFLFTEDTSIILFQNGWGNAEAFAEYFDHYRIYNARVITGFQRPSPNEVVITVHAQPIHIGSFYTMDCSSIESVAKAINQGGIPCETTTEIEKDLWAKMLYNCALNPLGAILDVPYGKLAEQEYTRQVMNNIIREVFAVMRSAGFMTHWQEPDEYLHLFYEHLVPDTATHRSSTLQDIQAKKGTEIDALNGVVIRLAEDNSIAVPYNIIVYNMVKFIESQNIVSATFGKECND